MEAEQTDDGTLKMGKKTISIKEVQKILLANAGIKVHARWIHFTGKKDLWDVVNTLPWEVLTSGYTRNL